MTTAAETIEEVLAEASRTLHGGKPTSEGGAGCATCDKRAEEQTVALQQWLKAYIAQKRWHNPRDREYINEFLMEVGLLARPLNKPAEGVKQ